MKKNIKELEKRAHAAKLGGGEDRIKKQHLHLYLRYLEQIVQNYKHVTFYNWLSQGAKMEGVIDIESINEIFPHKKLRAEASCEE